ncbi:MAG: histidine phosphotransferase family protein [Alphaproteobacteria bacterium]|nr:histidine phosphotransferase family protein [Alphaproteobacteria bacterium]
MSDTVTLANLMISKLCHDIAAPMGAMGLGLEMLFDNTQKQKFDQETKDLIMGSLDSFKTRLRIFRALFSTEFDGPSFNIVKDILVSLGPAHKLQINTQSIPSGAPCKILLGLTYMSTEALVRGGTITIDYLDGSDSDIQIMAEGSIAWLRPEYVETLGDNPHSSDDQTPRTILPYYLRLLASDINKKIVYTPVNPNKFYLVVS